MPCGACGGARRGVDQEYEVTFRHDGSKERVPTLSEANIKLAASPQGGTKRLVAKAK